MRISAVVPVHLWKGSSRFESFANLIFRARGTRLERNVEKTACLVQLYKIKRSPNPPKRIVNRKSS